jgi:hypothetical protein
VHHQLYHPKTKQTSLPSEKEGKDKGVKSGRDFYLILSSLIKEKN